MEVFGAISAGEYWRSSDLNNGNYSSQYHEFDHHHDQQFINSVDDHFDVTNYGLEIPFNIWPSCDSTAVHDMALPNSCQSNNDSYGFHNFNPLQVSEDRGTEMFLDQNSHDWTNHFAISLEQSKAGDEKTSLKRSRSTIPSPNDDQNKKRSTKSRKTNQRLSPSDNENEEDVLSEENSNASQEEMTSSSSPKGKKRATRGAATDPQSIYARKRREKINERLRMLQSLVPNGTKVDISTMLEDAVQYVKFLQLQIKMLSSDELWMYAPLAHNGMNIGVDYLRHTLKQL